MTDVEAASFGARMLEEICAGHRGRASFVELSPAAPVATRRGIVPATGLRPGDVVETPAGVSIVRSSRLKIASEPTVRLSAGAIGCSTAMHVAQEQRILVTDWRIQLLFGLDEAVFTVGDLVGLPGIDLVQSNLLPTAVIEVDEPAVLEVGKILAVCAGRGETSQAGDFPVLSRAEATMLEIMRGRQSA